LVELPVATTLALTLALTVAPTVAPTSVLPAKVGVRFGFTVTKQMGNAVARNRIKRRLRAALSLTAANCAADRYDYVIIARADALTCDFQLLIADFIAGFARVHHTAANAVKPRSPTGKVGKAGR
jgi:ribonuclease P protein component